MGCIMVLVLAVYAYRHQIHRRSHQHMSPLAAQGGSARDHGCDIINAEEHTRVFAFEHKGDVFSQKCPIKTRLGSIKMCVKMSPLS